MLGTVVLTRPQGKNQYLADVLATKGVSVIALPALCIRQTIHQLPQAYLPEAFDLLIFVSAQAAQFYLSALAAASKCLPNNLLIATVGAASAQPFYEAGLADQVRLVHPPATHPHQDSEALYELLQPLLATVKRILLVRGQQGREWLSQRLTEHNKTLIRCHIYERTAAHWSDLTAIQLQHDLVKPQSVTFLLTSSESTQAVFANIVRLDLLSVWKQAKFVAIHPRIAACIQALSSFTPAQAAAQIQVCAPSQQAMLEALLRSAMPT